MRLRKTAKKEDIYDIEAIIYCLRESHKGIIIGKNGEKTKKNRNVCKTRYRKNVAKKSEFKNMGKSKGKLAR